MHSLFPFSFSPSLSVSVFLFTISKGSTNHPSITPQTLTFRLPILGFPTCINTFLHIICIITHPHLMSNTFTFFFFYPSFLPLIEGQVVRTCVCVCVYQCVRCNHCAPLLSKVYPDSFPPTRHLIGRHTQPIRARHQGALKLSFPPF